MSLFYDLHIHSCLSPCGDEDMTPNNIVNMSYLKGLDIIAVTDHNSAGNVRAVCNAAKGKIKVVPGIEVTTSEEVHVLCYFGSVEAAEDMGEFLKTNMSGIKNNVEIFGRQLLLNEEDEIVGEEENLLISAVNLDIYDVERETHKRGGIFVPAHIDRSSYSITANLGFLPPDLNADAIEITESGLNIYKEKYQDFTIITDSDAHFLENISEKNVFLDNAVKKNQKIFDFLCKF
ncbi:MAG: PHP domain-containing protein [Clostridia bacterium]|nr:PHP domain-containing protein [Clostridia bacterium]